MCTSVKPDFVVTFSVLQVFKLIVHTWKACIGQVQKFIQRKMFSCCMFTYNEIVVGELLTLLQGSEFSNPGAFCAYGQLKGVCVRTET